MDAGMRIMEELRSNGVLCYLPGIQKGPCRAPYVVVRGGGAYARGMTGSAGIGYRIISLYCFVPRESGNLPAHVAKVKEIMRELRDQVRPTGNEGPEMIESDYDARSQTIEYRVLRADVTSV